MKDGVTAARPLAARRMFLLALAVAIGFVVWLSREWSVAVPAYASKFVPAGPEPALSSPARIFLDNDSYYWILYAREMAQTGAWRIRHNSFENAPYGRPVHWSQAESWWLLALGYVRRVVWGENLPVAMEEAAVWAGPLQLMGLMAGLGFLLYRRLGAVPASLWVLGMASMGTLYWDFHALRPDHGGLQMACMLLCLAGLVLGGLGWVSMGALEPSGPRFFRALGCPPLRQARGWFVFSGFCGGLGLWLGATVQIFGVGLIAAGALGLVVFMPRSSGRAGGPVLYVPGLWRWWAGTGAVVSLLFYGVEYLPSPPGMRLEVNHPLYALAWLCAGNLLARLSARRSGPWRPGWPGLVEMAVCLAGVLALPALVLLGPPEWHCMRDPLSWRITTGVMETMPLSQTAHGRVLFVLALNFGVLPLVLVLAPWLAGRKGTPWVEWAALWMSFLLAFALSLAGLQQVRWLPKAAALMIWLLPLLLAMAWRNGKERLLPPALSAVVACLALAQMLIFGFLQAREVVQIRQGLVLKNDLVKTVLQQKLATGLGREKGKAPMRVMADPDLAGPLYYFAGIPSVVSYYWENREGLKAAIAFFGDEGSERARHVAQERGITHVLTPRSQELSVLFQDSSGEEQASRVPGNLAARLVLAPKTLPAWLQPDPEMSRRVQGDYRFRGVSVFSTLDVFRLELSSR